jgi:hypothetical protein
MFRRLEKEKVRSKHEINWNNFSFHYKNNEIKINIQDLYPFKPPQLLIRNIDHIDWFLKQYVQFNQFNFLKKFNITNQCICCDTIICSWVPTYTIDQVIDEYKLYYDKYEILKSMQLFYKQQLFDDLIYQTIFLYIDI